MKLFNFIINECNKLACPVGWSGKIHRLHTCRRIRLPSQWVSWNNTKQFDGEVPVMLELWGTRSPPLLPLLRNGSTWSDPIYRLNRTSCILMLNWIVWIRTVWLNWIAWNRNVFTIKLYLHLNCVLMLNWIILNGTVLTLKLYLH